jgi:hypothetical protein
MQSLKANLFTIYSNSFIRVVFSAMFLTVIITIPFLCPVLNAIEIKGMNYTAWDSTSLGTEDSDLSLANARKVGCNWIALCVWGFQDDINSTSIELDYSLYSPTTESVIHAINRCHELNMKVMLKPMIDCRDEAWRGYINPSPQWFASYQNFINFWADIAENYNVELFCAGCEYANTTQWSSSWRSIIQNIHSHYTGPVTYAANPDEEKNIDWWDELDYIGIDAYYPLTDTNNPTPAELNTAWSSRFDAIETWHSSIWPYMQIIFTEIGYRSVDGTNRTPWERPSPPYNIDIQEQADCYDALLSQCKDRSWWSGVFLWYWEVDPNFGGFDDPYYTPHNKPAETVLANYYICLRADLNLDSIVNFEDLSIIVTHWLRYYPLADIYPAPKGDSVIDSKDFAEFAKSWMVSLNLEGDINGDCRVNFEDAKRLADQWLSTQKPGSTSADLIKDGRIDFEDWALFASSWLEATP